MSRHLRVEKTATSCGECRRRKQRCNQGRPCSNCARRFPQPACEYKWTESRHVRPAQYNQQGTAASPLPADYAEDVAFQLPGAFNPCVSPGYLSSLPAQLAGNALHESGDVIRWSGIDILTQLPPSTPSEPQWGLTWSSQSANSVPPGPAAGDDGRSVSSSEAHAAAPPLQSSALLGQPLLVDEWQPNSDISLESWFSFPHDAQVLPGEQPFLAAETHAPVQGLLGLSATIPERGSADLLEIFVRTLAPFSAALDGKPESSNAYIKCYIPLCLQNALLAQTAMYTAACFLNEAGHLDRQVTLAHKSQAINLLNESLWMNAGSSDEIVAAHAQLILNEWYWGGTTDLGAHLRGLKEMVRLRGGFRSLGLHGLIAKMAITADVAIALSHQTTAVLQPGRQIEPLEKTQVPLRLALNSPLVSSLPRFADCAEALQLDPATAAILDDMRFLISAVLALPDEPSQKALQKISTTSAWIHNRTSALPDSSPRRSLAAAPAAAASATAPAIVVTGIEAGAETEARPRSSYARRGSWQSAHSTQSAASVASSDQAYSDQSADDHSTLSSLNRARNGSNPASPDPPDYLYQSVRLAAIIYSRAITQRQPFSSAAAPADFLLLWRTMWRVPLTAWKGVLGVFNWIMIGIAPAARELQGHDRFVKSMLANSLLQIGADNWELARGVMEASARLQGWLGGGAEERKR